MFRPQSYWALSVRCCCLIHAGPAPGLGGLILVVYQGIGLAGLSWTGMLYALLALTSMTAGTR